MPHSKKMNCSLVAVGSLLEVEIRPLKDSDSLVELTELLHSAYAALARDGLNFTATDQDVETTARRISEGECWVARMEEEIVGTIVLAFGGDDFDPPYYLRPCVAHFGQFGVKPTLQGRSIGSKLLNRIEDRARVLGASHLALDTAEPASSLIEFYRRRSFEFQSFHQWHGKSYRSVVMTKALISPDF